RLASSPEAISQSLRRRRERLEKRLREEQLLKRGGELTLTRSASEGERIPTRSASEDLTTRSASEATGGATRESFDQSPRSRFGLVSEDLSQDNLDALRYGPDAEEAEVAERGVDQASQART